jgi:hydrogenase-1 operon protein HyaF
MRLTSSPDIPEHTRITPRLYESMGALRDLLEKAIEHPDESSVFSLESLSPEECTHLVELLGEGEISGRILSDDPEKKGKTLHVRESNYPGLWLLGTSPEGSSNGVVLSEIEVGRSPRILRRKPVGATGLIPDERYEGPLKHLFPQLMNARPLLGELAWHLENHTPRKGPHKIFLNKLPLSEADAEWIDRLLKEDRISLVSRGYGACQIHSTAFPGLWRVLYRNPEGILLLDAICVTDVPDEVAATVEDMTDGLLQYEEFLKWIASDLS